VTTVALAVCLVIGGCAGTESASPGRSQPAFPVHTAAWRARVTTADQKAAYAHVTVAGGLVVVDRDRTVAVFDRINGRQRWVRRVDAYDGAAPVVKVSTGVVAVTYGQSSDDHVTARVDALDLATGRELWHRELGQWGGVTVFRDAIYAAACTGSGGCTVTRRHPRTGQGRWTVRTASPVAEVEEPSPAPGGHVSAPVPSSPPYLVLAGSGQNGYHRRLDSIVDSASGRPVTVPRQGQAALTTARTVVVGDNDDGCRTTLRGFDAHGGASRWRAEVFGFRSGDPGVPRDCTDVTSPLMDGGRALGVTPALLVSMSADRRPQVLDLDTGRRRWIGARPGVPVAVGDRIVVLRDTLETGPLRALDLRTGRQLWQSIGPMSPQGEVAVVGDHVVARQNGRAVVLDAANGRALWWSQAGDVAGVGTDWIALGPSAAENEISYYTL
jgi:outer membrane protein assembly factor BamB